MCQTYLLHIFHCLGNVEAKETYPLLFVIYIPSQSDSKYNKKRLKIDLKVQQHSSTDFFTYSQYALNRQLLNKV